MTTRINVNVDQQALLQRSREQTQSNRWAFLEGQNRSRVGKEAERQRDANRAARGITANGSIYNNRLRRLPPSPEPAAWRTGVSIDIAEGFLQNKGNRQYRVWSADKTAYCDCNFQLASYPQPAKKYGNPTYNHLSFSSLTWPGQPHSYAGMNAFELGGGKYTSTLYTSAYQDAPSHPSSSADTNYVYRAYYDAWDASATSNWTYDPAQSSAIELRDYFASSPTPAPVIVRLLPEWNPLSSSAYYNSEVVPGETKANETYSTTYGYSGEVKICLPVNKTSFILYLGSYDYKMRWYAGLQRTASYSVTDFGIVDGPWNKITGSGLGHDGSVNGTHWWVATSARIALQTSITISDSFSTLYENKEVSEKCFLVSTTSVRELAVPAGLSQKVHTIYKGFKERPVETVTNYNGAYVGTSSPVIVNPGDPWGPSVGLQYIDFTLQLTTTSLQYVSEYGYYSAAVSAKFEPTADWSLIKQYGIGALRAEFHLGGVTSFSPAVFGALDKGEDIRMATGQPYYNYADVKSGFLSGAPVPKVLIDGYPGSYEAPKINYDYTKAVPETVFEDMTSLKFFKNSARPFLYEEPFYELLQVWDWGNPGYCRTKLLALGFTEADLTP